MPVRVRIDQTAAAQIGVQIARQRVTDTTRRVLNRATVLTPVRTGNLRSHNKQRVQTEGLRVVGEVFNDANYAAAVHQPARPHVIRPRRKKVLKFTVGGQVVYARQVNHPGSKGRPWLLRALQEVAGADGYRVSST